MANQLLTISKITNESMMVLENELGFAGNLNNSYDDQFRDSGAKIGTTVNARKPPRFTAVDGQALVAQSIVETYVPVTLSYQTQVAVPVSSIDLSRNINDFNELITKPAMATLANKIDYTALQLAYKSTYNFAGTLGELTGTPTQLQAITAIAKAGQKLNENAAPMDGMRSACVGPASNAGLITSASGLFNPQQTISEQYRRGLIGKGVLGFDFYLDQNIPTHTSGTQNGTFATAASAQAGGNTVQADASTPYTLSTAAITGTLTAGTVFTIAGVYSVNPQSRVTTGSLQQFVVQADTLASATSVSILPYPVFSGSFQNVTSSTNSIGVSATCTILSGLNSAQYQQNMLFHKDAFTIASADLVLPPNTKADRVVSKAAGISLRSVLQYDIQSDNTFLRYDVLWGFKATYPELACRLTG
jgi:hypothetical protein